MESGHTLHLFLQIWKYLAKKKDASLRDEGRLLIGRGGRRCKILLDWWWGGEHPKMGVCSDSRDRGGAGGSTRLLLQLHPPASGRGRFRPGPLPPPCSALQSSSSS